MKLSHKTRFSFLILCLSACFALLSCVWARADGQGRELRAFWADGFNEGYKTPLQIDTLLQRLHSAHCNAIFAQMRKGGDAYYASHYEPWATDDATHFDALACLIEHAHRMQPPIAVHAWINTCAVGTGARHPSYHIAQLHPEWLSTNALGNSDDDEVRKVDPGNPDAADWTFRLYLDVVRHYDVDGIHFDFVRYGSRKFGYNPASVTRFLRQLPENYPLHHYKPKTLQAAALHAPDSPALTDLPAFDDPAWKQWRRDQVTNLVRKVYVHAVQLNPRIVVSAATIAWGNGPHNEEEWQRKSAAMNIVFQDWRGWLEEGILDLACPMTYFSGRRGMEYERVWSEWAKTHQYNRACAIAVGNYQLTLPQTLAQMKIARSRNEGQKREKDVRKDDVKKGSEGHWPYGVMLYSYAGTNMGVKPGRKGLHALEYQPEFYAMLGQPSSYARTPPFAAAVSPPSMPWKEQPTRGILKGTVHNSALMPLDGALITLESASQTGDAAQTVSYTRRTDGTGFYAFVELPPGTYRVRVTTPRNSKALTEANTQQANILAGQVTTCHFNVMDDRSSDAHGIETLPNLQTVPKLVAASPVQASKQVRIEAVTVVLGTDTYPGNLYVQDKDGFCLRVRLASPPAVPFQPGDVVAVLGTPTRIASAQVDSVQSNPVNPGEAYSEPALNNTAACLTDIVRLPDNAPIFTVSLQGLANGPRSNHGFARIRGRVIQSSTDYFTLESQSDEKDNKTANTSAKGGTAAGNMQVIVPIAGRKDFGVEAASFLPVLPAVGSLIAVTGLVQANARGENGQPENGETSVRLLPRASTDIVLISPPHADVYGWWQALAIMFVLILLAIFALRTITLRRRSRQQIT